MQYGLGIQPINLETQHKEIMNMKKVLFLSVLPLAFGILNAVEPTVISTAPNAKYVYLNNNFEEVTPNKRFGIGDRECRLLNDGKLSHDKAVVSTWGGMKEKRIIVRFEFPKAVQADDVQLAWCWSFGVPKQWFDRVNVYAGNTPEERNKITAFPHENKKGGHVQLCTVPFPKTVEARYFTVEIIQDAHVDHQFMGFCEIRFRKKEFHAEFGHPEPCNVFAPGTEIRLPFIIKGAAEGCRLHYRLKNYGGRIVSEKELALKPDGNEKKELVLGVFPEGYYELAGTLKSGKNEVKIGTSLIVAPVTSRTAAEALAADARFGIQGGFGSPEAAEAFCRLGLHWRRDLLCFGPLIGNDPEKPDWSSVDNKFKTSFGGGNKIMIFEVKTFPWYIADKNRFKKNAFGRMPKDKKMYQDFISSLIRRVPRDQKIFEIWNEPEDIFTPQDFAKTAQWTLEAIKKVRPDAIVGPNLTHANFLSNVMDYGGLEGMDMLTIHPYSPDFRSSPEAGELRERIRGYRTLMRKKLGKELPLYVTEIGWPTPPKGPYPNSEARQAQYMARAALILFAEDIKGVAPYCMGQSEKDPAEKEHYFGFVRKDHSPKPVLAAYANAARLLEGGRYIGDLKLGGDIGAMLFELKSGKRMAALYTDGMKKKITFFPDAEQLTAVDIVGETRIVPVPAGGLNLTLDDNPVYLIGIGPKVLEKLASGPMKQWSKVYRRGSRDASKVTGWDTAFSGKLPWSCSSPAFPADRFSVRWGAAYDESNLYLRIDVVDLTPGFNHESGAHIWKGDCVEVFLSGAPHVAVPGFLRAADYQLLLTPFGNGGKEKTAVYGIVENDKLHGTPVPGVRMEHSVKKNGWELRCAIPFASIGLPSGPNERTLGLEIQVDNAGPDHGRFILNSNGRDDNFTNAAVWSFLNLK